MRVGLAVDLDGLPQLFHNQVPDRGNWLRVKLEGSGKLTDAIGAVVTARGDDDFYAWRMVNGGEGYLAMSSLPIEIGTGSLDSVDLEIRWPSGATAGAPGTPPSVGRPSGRCSSRS